jgi:hypothetical protein
MDFEQYILTFEYMWNEEPIFPHDSQALRLALNKLTIFWQPHIFRTPDGTSALFGLTYPPEHGKIRMYVYVPPDCKDASCTSLGHELIHVAYGAIAGDMYPKHLNNGPRWPKTHYDFLDRVREQYLGI